MCFGLIRVNYSRFSLGMIRSAAVIVVRRFFFTLLQMRTWPASRNGIREEFEIYLIIYDFQLNLNMRQFYHDVSYLLSLESWVQEGKMQKTTSTSISNGCFVPY